MAVATPVVGDLVLLGAGSGPGPGLYLVTGIPSAGKYTVASTESPKDNHAGTVSQGRILAVYRAS